MPVIFAALLVAIGSWAISNHAGDSRRRPPANQRYPPTPIIPPTRILLGARARACSIALPKQLLVNPFRVCIRIPQSSPCRLLPALFSCQQQPDRHWRLTGCLSCAPCVFVKGVAYKTPRPTTQCYFIIRNRTSPISAPCASGLQCDAHVLISMHETEMGAIMETNRRERLAMPIKIWV
ncbi:hypothetical protein B0T25DRAFT_30806 [Lasiosphaeria hispida]|uniref:Secreted protein n=1 Tax=Lasiosphaeria hispida TaxID=260671 RepID=A0AAJ0HUN2_9PEZI|nr:hypothetical protein B0T25DRAFT_30806 [Lasiosphaeria hispida]